MPIEGVNWGMSVKFDAVSQPYVKIFSPMAPLWRERPQSQHNRKKLSNFIKCTALLNASFLCNSPTHGSKEHVVMVGCWIGGRLGGMLLTIITLLCRDRPCCNFWCCGKDHDQVFPLTQNLSCSGVPPAKWNCVVNPHRESLDASVYEVHRLWCWACEFQNRILCRVPPLFSNPPHRRFAAPSHVAFCVNWKHNFWKMVTMAALSGHATTWQTTMKVKESLKQAFNYDSSH
jgi:hypothetical protein